MKAQLARTVLVLLPALSLACAKGGDDNGTVSPPDDDSGADTSLTDTALPDAPIDTSKAETSTLDSGIADSGGTETADSGGTETTDSGGTETADSGGTETTDSGADTNTDSSRADSGIDTSVIDSGVDTTVVDSGIDTTVVDSGVDSGVDTRLDVADADALLGPYRHTISIDGVNDFNPLADKFDTTSTGYNTYVSWDADSLYVGYSGPDIGASSTTKWVLVYLDVDAGATTGATSGVLYNTEKPSFPSGFGAEYYLRWRTDDAGVAGTFTLEQFSGGAWSTKAATITKARNTTTGYVEFKIPLFVLGAITKLGVTSFMVNEVGGAEAAFAGIYPGNFTDGYHATIPLTKYLDANFSLAAFPNDASRVKP